MDVIVPTASGNNEHRMRQERFLSSQLRVVRVNLLTFPFAPFQACWLSVEVAREVLECRRCSLSMEEDEKCRTRSLDCSASWRSPEEQELGNAAARRSLGMLFWVLRCISNCVGGWWTMLVLRTPQTAKLLCHWQHRTVRLNRLSIAIPFIPSSLPYSQLSYRSHSRPFVMRGDLGLPNPRMENLKSLLRSLRLVLLILALLVAISAFPDDDERYEELRCL